MITLQIDDRARDINSSAKRPSLSKQLSPPLRAELHGSRHCEALGHIATGYAPALALCRQLLAAGLDPDRSLHVYRNGILSLRIRTIHQGGELAVEDAESGTPRFRLARPPRRDAASPMRKKRLEGTMTPRGGRRSRDKGNRAERALVAYLQDTGFAAERVPLSGLAGGSFVGDITVPLLGRDLTVEVEVRGRGFSQLYNWLHERDALILKRDRDEAPVVVPLKLASEIAIAAEREKDCK